MALQVWLPLNGNIENHGVSNAYVVNNGTTVSNSGKIGKCYSFTQDQYLSLNNVPFSTLTNCSVCFWIYIDSYESWLPCTGGQDGTNTGQYFLATSSNTGAFYHSSVGSNNITIYRDGVIGTTPLAAGAWHHYCITGLDLSTWVGMAINRYGGYPDWNFMGKLNDFRIYDHCLSPKEVKEIAKGLMLHYPMNDKISGANLVKNHAYNIYDNYGVPSSLTKLNEKFQGCDVYRLTMTPTSSSVDSFKVDLWSHGIYGFTQTFKANTKYCFWIYYRPVTNPEVRVGGTASNISGWTEIPPKHYGGDWYVVGQYRNGSDTSDRFDNIFTSFYTPSATVGTPITIDFCCPHLVEGSSEIIDDGDYQGVINRSIIHDCSGFENNGTVTSTITASSNTPRYNTSLFFDGYEASILIGDFSQMVSEGIFTFNCWFYKNDWGPRGYETIFGGPSGFELEAKNSTTNSPYLWAYSWGQGATTYNLNTWNMVTMVRTPSDCRFYLNGELFSVGGAGSIPSGNYFIGAWNSSSQQNYRGNISDVRIYATALSESDVKDLYSTSAVVCDNGTVMTYSLEE